MDKYYIFHENSEYGNPVIGYDNDEYGPYTIDELKRKQIYTETKLRKEDDDEWKNADEFPELVPIIVVEVKSENGRYFGYEKVNASLRSSANSITVIIYLVILLIPQFLARYLAVAGLDIVLSLLACSLFLCYILTRYCFLQFSASIGQKIMGMKVISGYDGKDINKTEHFTLGKMLGIAFEDIMLGGRRRIMTEEDYRKSNLKSNTLVVLLKNR